MCPHCKAALVRLRTSQCRESYTNCFHTHVSLCFLSVFRFRLLLSFYLTFSSSFSFLQLNTINCGLHLRIMQTLCLHFSRPTPLRKTLAVNHYLRIEYFQHLRQQAQPHGAWHSTITIPQHSQMKILITRAQAIFGVFSVSIEQSTSAPTGSPQ